MRVKQKIRAIFAVMVSTASRILVRCHLTSLKVVIHVDGGICSQMTQWLMGQYYTEGGYDVYYDLEWYKRWGKGLDGKIEMPFELKEMCPDITVRRLSAFQNEFYRLFLRITEYENNLMPARKNLTHSIYITRYPAVPDREWWDEAFSRFFGIGRINTVPADKFPIATDKMMCAVHVRRGDLAKLNIPGHYIVTPTQYFFDTINYVVEKYQKVRFCFFSDELDFIETDILPYLHLPKDCDYVMMRGNKGYEDLVLVAKCDMIIGSQGTASRHGARMNPKAGLILPKIEKDSVVGFEIIKDPIGKKLWNIRH